MNSDFIQMCITVLLAIAGWIMGYYLTSKSDQHIKRRDFIIEHLSETYRVLTEVAHCPLEENHEKFENILSDIQLFGSIKQIELVRALTEELANKKTTQLDLLIHDLRNDLRKQLKLEPVKGNVIHLRVSPPSLEN